MNDTRFVPSELDRLAASAAAGNRQAEAAVIAGVEKFVYGLVHEVIRENKVRLTKHFEDISQQALCDTVELVRRYRADKGASVMTYLRRFMKPLIFRYCRGYLSPAACRVSEKARWQRGDPVFDDVVYLSSELASDGDGAMCVADILVAREKAEADEEATKKGHLDRLNDLDDDARLALQIRYQGTGKPKAFGDIAAQMNVSTIEVKRLIARAYRVLGLVDLG